jgi:integrase
VSRRLCLGCSFRLTAGARPQALRWQDVDLADGVIRVERGWDARHGDFIEPKSRKGRRTVPIPRVLRAELLRHRMAMTGDGLMFGRSSGEPFASTTIGKRAEAAWKAAGVEPTTFHACRHSYASTMIAADVNPKALSSFMGHASITVTFDLYGHLMRGAEDEAASLLDAYLAAATG